MDETTIFFVGRLAERLIVVLCGGLSLTFGWHLFKIGVVTDQSAEFSKKEFTVRLQKVGPGVFFALFGAVVLAISLYRPLVLSGPTGVSYFAERSDQEAFQDVTALNTQLQIMTPAGLRRLAQPDGQSDMEELLRTRATIENMRNQIVAQKFGKDAMEVWTNYGDRFLRNPENVPKEHRGLLSDMVDWMKETL